MLEIIESESQINEIQRALYEKLVSSSIKFNNIKIGHQGGSGGHLVYWIEENDFWYTYQKHRNRHWNAFGLGRPDLKKQKDIICEINIPFTLNRRIGGAFAIDKENNINLLHRGLIGGGRKGIGKKNFFHKYKSETKFVSDGDRETEVLVIGEIYSDKFLINLKKFIDKVNRFKEEMTTD